MSATILTQGPDAAHPNRIEREKRIADRKRIAKADCLKFATSFCTTMPREVRDQVYSYLYLPDPHMPLKLFKAEQESGQPATTDMPHWQSHEFVGPDFAREYTEVFYSNTELHFDPSDSPGIFPITNILQNDPFGTNVLPSDFIRSCIVDFSERRCDYTKHVDASLLTTQLNALLTLKPHPARKVTFRIDLLGARHEHLLYDTMFKHILFLGPLLYNFKDQGLGFNVLLLIDFSLSRQDWRDVTFLWDMPSTDLFYKLHEWAAAYGMSKSKPRVYAGLMQL
jgi:hypothetical protein